MAVGMDVSSVASRMVIWNIGSRNWKCSVLGGIFYMDIILQDDSKDLNGVRPEKLVTRLSVEERKMARMSNESMRRDSWLHSQLAWASKSTGLVFIREVINNRLEKPLRNQDYTSLS